MGTKAIMSDVPQNLQNAIEQAKIKNTQRENCGFPSNYPQIYFQTIHKVALGGAKADVYIKFPQPINTLWIASKDSVHATDSLYFHFIPLQKSYGGNQVTVSGAEQWFDMSYTPDGANAFKGKLIRFREAFIDGYFDIGQEAGGSDYLITVAGSNGSLLEMRDNVGAINV